ncbi:MAG: T9SS type A sorting domain-containing protein, partial [Acidobacteriaceae bacterium]
NSDGTSDYSQSGRGPGKGPYYDTVFPAQWTPAVVGTHQVCGVAIMANDQLRADDTTCGPVLIRPIYDAAAVAVVNPQPDQEMPEKTSWKPAALFQSTGVSDLFDVPVEVQIHRCTDGMLVFKSDTTMPELNIDQNQVRMYFPADNGGYHISALPPGCYTICAIANYLGDGDHTNDTACSEFSIIPQLKGNIYVGVGQRFQSIHAALDSLRFRGIGGPLNLILTDQNYTEDGSHAVSSLDAALDFRGISGLSDSTPVTWEPKPGVTPTITFTGPQPSCFYFGDLFGGFMTFEGYNPLGVPVADKVTPEPNKRGITIVDNETSPGPVFNITEGASHLTLKDLVLHGNGNFANDSSAVIRIDNEQNQTIYLQAVRDTVPINHVVINNCELGNAKYGIWDQGLHDMFSIGQEKFIVWRNTTNTFTRNTIGTADNPLSYAGIQFTNEQDMTISHNEISNVNTSNAGGAGAGWNAFGIESPSPVEGDTGNVVRIWIDGNRIHNIRATNGISHGVAIRQAITIYSIGNGSSLEQSTLPIYTQNRVTNNMIFDLQSTIGSYPILMATGGAEYSADEDSIFNNSISTSTALANIKVQYAKHVFLWDNILQNTSAGPYANYWLEIPHPFANAISSDYNLFDLHGTNVFDSLIEYDVRYGTVLQTRYFRTLNDWRSYVAQDMHSLTGDPRFTSDSLHMPSALTYIESPAMNNGAWLGTSTQAFDFDGNPRVSSQAVSIGAEEWNGFQYTNDLAVMSIVQPAGFSETSDTSLVTTENPLWITAWVKNLSSQSVFSRSVNAQVQQAINGGPWVTIYNSNSAPMNWGVNETKSVAFMGPVIDTTTVAESVFRIVVSVPSDQNNGNNSQSKTFRILLKRNAVLVSYNGSTPAGLNNLDSVEMALARLNVPYDLLDRNAPDGLTDSTDIDYTPWWTLIWVSGDPSMALTPNQPTGEGALSFKETMEIERYLNQGETYAKKDLVVAGQNIAYYNGYVMPNNNVTDTEWLQSYMHTQYVANSPVSGAYSSWIDGQQPAYWKFPDSLNSLSPDVVRPSFATPLVGPIVTGFAYTYRTHPMTPDDSGAGTTYYDPRVNTVFYGFDWADPVQTLPGGFGDTTSGTTRTLAAAFAFFRSHAGTILPVEFVNAWAEHVGQNDLIHWQIAQQKDVAGYDIQQQLPGATADAANWITLGHINAQDNQTQYAYTDANIDLTQSYTFRVVAVDKNGAKTFSNAIELGPDVSAMGYTLGQNYPNPTATGATQVTFTLPESAQVTLRVLDVTGKVMMTPLANVNYTAGEQTVSLDLSNLANGSYVYQLVATGQDGQTVTLSKKLTLNK